MTLTEILFIAFGLAADAFAVSMCVGATEYLKSKRARFRISFHFGLFQALMPIVGWLAGSTIERHIERFDHWIAFALLVWVGGKMIKESCEQKTHKYQFNPSRGWSLVLLSVATSIDALAVGFSLACIDTNIGYPAVMIGLITSALSLTGVLLGSRLGSTFGKRVEFVGGLVLIFIGVRIVVEHIFF